MIWSTRSRIQIARATTAYLDLYLHHRHPAIHHQHAERRSSTVNCAGSCVAPTPPLRLMTACGNALTPVAGTAPDCNRTVKVSYGLLRSRIQIARATSADLDLYLHHRHPAIHHQHAERIVYRQLPGRSCCCAYNRLRLMTACGNALTPVAGTAPTATELVKVIWSTTFTYTDCAGNSSTWTYTYTIDIPPFTISTPNGIVYRQLRRSCCCAYTACG